MAADSLGYPDVAARRQLDSLSSLFWTVNIAVRIVAIVIGAVGSVACIAAALKLKRLRSSTSALLVNRTVADLLSVSTMFFAAGLDQEITYDATCRVVGPIKDSFMSVSVYTVAAIALNRYTLVCATAERYACFFSTKGTAAVIAITWLLGAAVSLPPVMGFGSYGYNTKVHDCHLVAYDDQNFMHLVTIFLPFCMLPSLCISVAAYAKLVLRIRASRQSLRAVAQNPGVTAPVLHSSRSSAASPERGRLTSVVPLSTFSAHLPNATLHIDRRLASRFRCHAAHSVAPRRLFGGGSTSAADRRAVKEWKVTLRVMLLSMLFVATWTPILSLLSADRFGHVSSSVYVASITAGIVAWAAAVCVYLWATVPLKRVSCNIAVVPRFFAPN